MNIAFVTCEGDPERWLPSLRKALPRDRFFTWPEIPRPAAIEVALVAKPPPGELVKFSGLKLIQSMWMGVDGLLAEATLPRHVPIARMVDPGMVAAMGETVLAHVIDWHRHLYRYRAQQAAREWKMLPQHMASDRTVGLLGLGELGAACASRLVPLGFKVIGWSRRPKDLPGVECLHGDEGFAKLLARSGALVCLLPLTAQTRGILNAENLARLPQGACVINVARGAHVVEQDLRAALDSGHLAHAWLDVFETEPLPEAHPFWSHPGVTLTPHIAALTEPRTSLAVVVENIERVRRGAPALHGVDLSAGY
jgi:glyoxylate/hydroxypyruvate reductase